MLSSHERHGMREPRAPLALALMLALLAGGLLACSTHRVALGYAPTRGFQVAPDAAPRVAVGSFEDARETDDDWLGAIRGGYGNPLKRLRTQRPTAERLRDLEALHGQGLVTRSTRRSGGRSWTRCEAARRAARRDGGRPSAGCSQIPPRPDAPTRRKAFPRARTPATQVESPGPSWSPLVQPAGLSAEVDALIDAEEALSQDLKVATAEVAA